MILSRLFLTDRTKRLFAPPSLRTAGWRARCRIDIGIAPVKHPQLYYQFCRIGLVILTSLAVTANPALPPSDVGPYPETRRLSHVDEYHGFSVIDPYRWLEEDVRQSEAVADWVAAQNDLTFSYLKSIPEREAIRQRLTELWDYERFSPPKRAGQEYYFFKNDGLQNQSVLYELISLDGEPQILLDPNRWSEDGTIALKDISFSDDGSLLAYGVAEAGSDWVTWRVMDVDTRKVLEDEIRWIKFSGVAWTPDNRGFFYSRYDAPKEGSQFQQLNLNQKIYYHRLGGPQTDDVLVYHRPDQPEWGFGVQVTEDGRYLVITVWKGTDDKFRILYKDLAEPYGMPVELIPHFENEYSFLGNNGPRFFFKTDLKAPKGRIVAIDIGRPEAEPEEIVAEKEENLRAAGFVGDLIVAQYLRDVLPAVRLFTADGQWVRDVSFPDLGTASGFDGRRSDTETFYLFSSLTAPPTIYRYDLLSGESRALWQTKVNVHPDQFVMRQVFFQSRDGTRIPMFVAHRKGLELNGDHPTLLYGYGGFNIPLLPDFSTRALAWMDLGGVFAMANLRGGGEYGEAWHRAGTRLKKQNVFDDFIAAAEWLCQTGYTRPEKLAIQGGSNGGLLVGAVLTQRPELFGACLPSVGVMDMLRFHQFTAGRFWVDDYGSADVPEEFHALRAYSPYHNIRPGVEYPPTLITTADTDDRVVPGHSFKFAAELQHAQAGPAPILIRIETRAGHGAGTPTRKAIDKAADEFAFLVQVLEMQLPRR